MQHMDCDVPRPTAVGVRSAFLSAWSGPLTGCWARRFWMGLAGFILLFGMLHGFELAETLPSVAKGRNVQVRWTRRLLGVRETFEARPMSKDMPVTLDIGCLRITYRYDRIGRRNLWGPVIYCGLMLITLGVPIGVGRVVLGGGSFRRFVWGMAGLTGLLLFPLGLGCNAMRCEPIYLARILSFLLFG